MKRSLLVLLLLPFITPAWAGHDWFGVDLCRSRPELMPPGLAPSELPEPDSPGARLVARHCVQCHNLPGPGHHTAQEWRRVAPNMFMLSEVTSRFGGRPELAIPSEAERETITAYLQRHALTPLPEGRAAPEAYLSICGDCHAAPDPGLHNATDWPAVMARMAGHRSVMAREPLNSMQATRVLAYLSEYAAPERKEPFLPGRWLALAPVLALAGFALWRMLRPAVKIGRETVGRDRGRPA